jgi:S-DNA-T family DNA segregation ATPase FtsK/SpoIIIE
VSVAALRRFTAAHTTIDGAPVALALRGVPAVAVTGDPDTGRDLLRAAVCQAAVLHGPGDVRIAVVDGAGRRQGLAEVVAAQRAPAGRRDGL